MVVVTYRLMNEIVVTNESEWAEHMYVMFACYVLFMLLCINSFSSRLDMQKQTLSIFNARPRILHWRLRVEIFENN
jgi:hypothetical protein